MIQTLIHETYKNYDIYRMYDSGASWFEIYSGDELLRHCNTVEEAKTHIDKITVNQTIENPNWNTLFKAMTLINEYCEEEFEHGAVFENLHEVGLACSTVGEYCEIERQVSVDLIDPALIIEDIDEDGTYHKYMKFFETVNDLTNHVLTRLSFEDLLATDTDRF